MQPYIEIGNNIFPAWALFWCIGIVTAQLYLQWQGKILGLRWHKSLLAGGLLLLTEMLGAKLLYMAENWERIRAEGLSFGGFSLFGVFIAVPILSLLWAKWLHVPYKSFLDYSCGGILLELAFYRVGCFFTGCCGTPPSGIGFWMPDGTKRFPIQLVEAVLDLAILAWLFFLGKKKKILPGMVFGLMLSLYGVVRFVLEFFRERETVWKLLSGSHFLAMAAFVTGILFTILIFRKGNYEKNTN